MATKEEMVAAFESYEQHLESGGLSDQQADNEFAKVEELVPHARLSALCFWG